MGTSSHTAENSYAEQDHPHAYGDKRRWCPQRPPSQGSSPRVWGQAFRAISGTPSEGIIPTRMGTSSYDTVRKRGIRDHPHAYGDKGTYAHCTGIMQGSSPRVWGQACIGYSDKIPRRIIPTRMGTSATSFITSEYNEDHPHAYGDK